MNIIEKSKEYAKGKALDAITAAIEQAYADGFADGYREAKIRLEAINTDYLNLDVNYVDLDLPSGTLWSQGYVIKSASILRLPYEKTSRLNIPTETQFYELCSNCQIEKSPNVNQSIRFTGKNGEYIDLLCLDNNGEQIRIDMGGSFRFWLKDDGEETKKNYAWIGKSANGWKPFVTKIFMGNSLPLMLVR